MKPADSLRECYGGDAKFLDWRTVLEREFSLIRARIYHFAKAVQSKWNDLPALFGRHVPMAPQMLRKLLDGHILCEPVLEEGKPGYRFTATGTLDRLMAGAWGASAPEWVEDSFRWPQLRKDDKEASGMRRGLPNS